MKKVNVVKGSEVDIETFYVDDFIQDKETIDTTKAVTKKELRKLAQQLNLDYTDSDIDFSKKLLNAYLVKR